MDDGHPILRIGIFIIILLMNIFLSGTDKAISALNATTLNRKASEGDKKAAAILSYAHKDPLLLSTLNVIATCAAILVGVQIIDPLLYKILDRLDFYYNISSDLIFIIVYVIGCLIVIYYVIVFSVLIPKRLGVKYAEKWAYSVIGIVSAIITLFKPFLALINASVNLFIKLFGINADDYEDNVTEEEIIMMVSEGHEQGVIEASEAEMISNIFEFDDKEVADIMTHRSNICGIDCTLSVSQAAEIMSRERYSRYPVYEGDLDNIIGILHLKDVMRLIVSGNTNVDIQDIMRQPFFVPDTQNINVLFKDMQARKRHMAIVVDEYGQSCGLVAMEDILEEIVGNIMDEYDQDENNIQAVGGSYLIKGLTPLEEISEVLGITFDDEFETLNGLLISTLDRIPESNEFASVELEGYNFKIMSVRDNTISLVKVTKITG
jgi:putative hemolysin